MSVTKISAIYATLDIKTNRQTGVHLGLETFLLINCLIDNGLLQARPECDQDVASFEAQ